MKEYKLGDIADIVTGPFGSALHQNEYVDDGIPVIMPQDIGNRTLSYEKIAYITEEKAAELSRYIVYEDDIVYARRGDIEKHAFIRSEDEGAICGTGCLRVRIKDKSVNPIYLSFYLNRPETRKWIVLHAVGSNMPNINAEILGNVPIELPSIDVQLKTADFLDNIDRKIINNRNLCGEVKRLLETIYEYWFIQFDFPNEDGRPYKTCGGKMIWNEELNREIPYDWEVCSLRDLVVKGNTDSYDGSDDVQTIDMSVMPSANIMLDELNQSSNFNTNLFVMKKGDLLFGSIRPYLKKAGIAPCDGAVAGTVHNIRVKNKLDYNFVAITLFNDRMFSYAVNTSQGTKMPVVTIDSILDYKVAYNQEISHRFNSILDTATVFSHCVMDNQELRELRNMLLPFFMNGQVSIS